MRPSQTSPKWANFNIRERQAADACPDLTQRSSSRDTVCVIDEEGMSQVYRPLLGFLTGILLIVLHCLFAYAVNLPCKFLL